MPTKCQWILRVLDLIDIVALIVLTIIAISKYIARDKYSVDSNYLVGKDVSYTDCDPEEAY